MLSVANTALPVEAAETMGKPVTVEDADVEQQGGGDGPLYTTFSRSAKVSITAMAAVACVISPFTALIYLPALKTIADDLGVSIGLINLTVTSFMVFQALSPTLMGDFADMAGRRPALGLALVIYLAANISLGLQRNYVALLLLRCVQSIGSSGTVAIAVATVADLASSGERGKYMGIVSSGATVGPALGPFLGGVLAEFLGWPSIFWFCAILTAIILVPLVLFVPETCRSVVGNGSYPAQRWNQPLIAEWLQSKADAPQGPRPDKRKLRFPNPLRALAVIFDKEMAILLFYASIIYVCFVDVAATMGTHLGPRYHLNDFQIGLCYLPYGVGCFLAALVQGFVLDRNYARLAGKLGMVVDRKRGDDLLKFPIESARIQPTYAMLATGVVAMAGYGWILQIKTHLAIPLVLLFLVGGCLSGAFLVLNTLIIDLNPAAPATATAAHNLVRCLMGAGGTAIVESMLQAMGEGWCFTFLALVCASLSPCMMVLEKRGPTWRRSKAESGCQRTNESRDCHAKGPPSGRD